MSAARKDHAAHDAVTPVHAVCPRCDELSPAGAKRCGSCNTWLLDRGPTASELRDEAVKALRYPPEPEVGPRGEGPNQMWVENWYRLSVSKPRPSREAVPPRNGEDDKP